MNTIHQLAADGKSIHDIARSLGLARNTVRKYLRGALPRPARPARPSKLDPFKDQIRRWIHEDHLLNCETMLLRLQDQGYTGQISILKDFVKPLRPPSVRYRPIRRYETAPGEQVQCDWGEFRYEQDGKLRKLFGFTAVLSYSRLRFVTFVKRCDTPSLIRCLMAAFEAFGGLPRTLLTDRMKSVLLQMDGATPIWNPRFSDFLAAIGVAPRVCRPYTPQTKGKVERTIQLIKRSFWPGVHFHDLDDLNRQAQQWCAAVNARVHRTTRERPVDRWSAEPLAPLPPAFAWERFATEDRKISWDNYLSYDGVQYGVPAEPLVAGMVVQVREQAGTLRVWSQGQLIVTLRKRAQSGTIVPHPAQFTGVPPAVAAFQAVVPLGHLVSAAPVARRPLADYDRLYQVGGST